MAAAAATIRGEDPGPGPAVAQLDHAVWTLRDGAPSDVRALAQSLDGVAWIGAAAGRYQSDGARFRALRATGCAAAAVALNVLLALPDGTLRIGYLVGGASVFVARATDQLQPA